MLLGRHGTENSYSAMNSEGESSESSFHSLHWWIVRKDREDGGRGSGGGGGGVGTAEAGSRREGGGV